MHGLDDEVLCRTCGGTCGAEVYFDLVGAVRRRFVFWRCAECRGVTRWLPMPPKLFSISTASKSS